LPAKRLWTTQATGRDLQTEDKWFNPYCPIRNVTSKYPPTMLIHGTADTDVPYSLSKDMDGWAKPAWCTSSLRLTVRNIV